MNNAQLVYCNTDENGTIVELYHGFNIIPSKPYRYFFMISGDIEIPMEITLPELHTWQNDYIDTLN